jgi:hypothetical protein
MHTFLWGALVAISMVNAVFFLRFWRTSGDRLFVFFALAFALMAASWGWIATGLPQAETRHYAYVLRLLAFVLIIVAIVDKNRRARVVSSDDPPSAASEGTRDVLAP